MHGCDFRIDLAKKKFYVIYFILQTRPFNDKKGEEQKKDQAEGEFLNLTLESVIKGLILWNITYSKLLLNYCKQQCFDVIIDLILFIDLIT